jgi:hypothetical protein
MDRIVEYLREAGLVKKRSIPGWILFALFIAWQALGHASTADWAWGLLHPKSTPSVEAYPPAGWSLMEHSWIVSFVLFFAGLIWLTVVVVLSRMGPRGPQISAKYLRKHLMPRSPWAGITAKLIRSMNAEMAPSEHDLLLKVYLVNLSRRSTTIQKITAEAEIDGKWELLKAGDLQPYCLAFEKESSRSGAIRTIKSSRIALESLWEKVRDVELRQDIGFSGWLAFQIDAPTDKLGETKTNFRVSIVDAANRAHPIVGTDAENEVEGGRIAFMPQ